MTCAFTRHIMACTSYSLPVDVQPYVELITPTVHFDALALVLRPREEFSPSNKRHEDSKPVSGAAKSLGQPWSGNGPNLSPDHSSLKGILTELKNCDKFITPICLRTLYGIFYWPIGIHKNSYGVVEYTPSKRLGHVIYE
jgi:tripeptidyl-peptidase I